MPKSVLLLGTFALEILEKSEIIRNFWDFFVVFIR